MVGKARQTLNEDLDVRVNVGDAMWVNPGPGRKITAEAIRVGPSCQFPFAD